MARCRTSFVLLLLTEGTAYAATAVLLIAVFVSGPSSLAEKDAWWRELSAIASLGMTFFGFLWLLTEMLICTLSEPWPWGIRRRRWAFPVVAFAGACAAAVVAVTWYWLDPLDSDCFNWRLAVAGGISLLVCLAMTFAPTLCF